MANQGWRIAKVLRVGAKTSQPRSGIHPPQTHPRAQAMNSFILGALIAYIGVSGVISIILIMGNLLMDRAWRRLYLNSLKPESFCEEPTLFIIGWYQIWMAVIFLAAITCLVVVNIIPPSYQ